MKNTALLQWTLSARIDGRALEFGLGDGHRLALTARRSAQLLQLPSRALTAAELFGAELAQRLASSAPRPLCILYDGGGALDGVEWEQLSLGADLMAEHFALSRQLLSSVEPAPLQFAPLAEALSVTVVCVNAAGSSLTARHLGLDALDQHGARDIVANSHVLVLDNVQLSEFLERVGWPPRQRLLILAGPQSPKILSDALDAGAAVLSLTQPGDLVGEPVQLLVQHLGRGQGVGEAVGWLRRRATRRNFEARLYGDPDMRFVRPQLPTSRRQVTSLSFDLVGSTTMLTSLGDEAYAETLADVHACCTDIVRRLGGQPDDPQGDDGVMCYFGHPSAVEDAAVHAVMAGMRIVRTVAELGVMVRVGIATGLVAIKAGQPIGLSIHLAARLQQAATPGTVLASESTRRLVAHAFDLKALLDQPPLKGIDASECVYLVIGSCNDVRAQHSEQYSALTPMVGRQAELDRLHRCWGTTGDDEGSLVVVSGEAGMGKSRLVREFRHQLVQAGVKVLECRCRTDACASPFLTLGEALRRWLDIHPDDPAELALSKLAAALPSHVQAGEPLAFLGALLGLAPLPPRAASGNPHQRFLELLVDWFQGFAHDQSCCLIVEDWQWVDPSMRELVEQLIEPRKGPGLLVVITFRSEAAPAPFASRRHEHIELTGLAPMAARQLVDQVCASTPLTPRQVALLAARGDGVPLFLEEAARMALELRNDGNDAELRALDAVPASLHDLLMARLDRLGATKQVAQVASILGRHFSRELLTALLDSAGYAQEAAVIDERLAALVGSGLVRSEGEGRFVFRHALIRDAAYASMWSRDRRALHARVVQLLRERWPELTAQQPELLALHLTEAGLHAQALAQWEVAARHAAARSAELEAISHLRRALSVLGYSEVGIERDRAALRLQLLLAARLLATEGYGADAVLRAYLEAQSMCDRMGDDTARFKVEMGLEAYRFMRADFAPALEHGRRAAAIAVHSNDIKQRLHAHWGLACTLFHQGKLRAAMREMETALTEYSPALHPQFGIQDPGVMCMAYSAWGLWELGRPDSALSRIDHAVSMAKEFEHRFSQAVALSYGVSIELLRGEVDAAFARADVCMHVCEDAKFPVWLAITRCMRGYLLCERGEFATGLSEMTAGYAQWLATGAMVSQPLYLSLQVQGLMLAGQLDAASARVDEGLAIIGRYGERQLEAELMRLRGEIDLRRGDVATGEHWLRRAYALALRHHRLGFALRSATSLARHWAGAGRPDSARRLLVPLTARWKEGRGTRDLRAAVAVIDSMT